MALNDNEHQRAAASEVLTGLANRARALASTGMHALRRILAAIRRWYAGAGERVGQMWDRIEPWLERQPIWGRISKTIGRRILFANLFGFTILFCGLMVLSQMNRWLVDAKTESLTTQARMIAAAITADAKVERGGLTLDPARLDDLGTPRPTLGDDTFASIRLAIAPEQVAPVLARLIPYGDVRARIHGPDGFLILDTNQRLQRGQLSRQTSSSGAPTGPSQPLSDDKLRSTWTFFVGLFTREGLNVYREVQGERGIVYPEVQRALDGLTAHMLLVTADGLQSAAVAHPIMSQGEVRGAILLSSRPGDLDEAIWRQRRAMLVLSLIALLTSLVSAWLLHRTIAGPMARLSEAAQHVSRSINAQHELPDYPHRRDEVATLAKAFKEMTNALFRRIEASDRFAQDVAHELKNPVAAARGTAESLAYARTDAQREEAVRQIQGEMRRLNRLITDISKASRLEGELALQETEPLDFAGLTRAMADMLDANDQRDRHVVMTAASGDQLTYMVDGHEVRLGQVMTNLIDNALSFSAPGGTVRVHVRREADEIVATIDDDGPGIPPDRLEHVFKRFYSDRPQSDRTQGKNSGLGLSISQEIVQAHRGRLWAENRMAAAGELVGVNDEPELKARRIPGVAGARFTVVLPAMATPMAR